MMKRYWLYAPGKQAKNWEEFYQKGIFGLNWNRLKPLNSYPDVESIAKDLRRIENTTSSKRNDAAANYNFLHEMNIGDIIILKKGLHEILGYGEVTSDYFFDDTRDNHKHLRRAKWHKKGEWKVDFTMPLKTLTDLTDKASKTNSNQKYWEDLMRLMKRS